LPANTLGAFVRTLAQQIALFPAAGLLAIKERVNDITLAPADDFRRDSDHFAESARSVETQRRIEAAMRHRLQTRDGEMEFSNILDELT
jgi:hypothetical protein